LIMLLIDRFSTVTLSVDRKIAWFLRQESAGMRRHSGCPELIALRRVCLVRPAGHGPSREALVPVKAEITGWGERTA
jgi:hypothetical protein